MKIYHNPRCGKSREALKILEEKGVRFETYEYLKEGVHKKELKDIVSKLSVPVIDIVRTNESVWKEKYKGKNLSEDKLLNAIIADPILLQRPIVVTKEKAVIGRPPEAVLKVL